MVNKHERVIWTHHIYIFKKERVSFCRIHHFNDIIMGAVVSQIISISIVYSTVFRRISKKTLKLRVTGLCEGNSPVTGEFPAQRASNAENVSCDDLIMLSVCAMIYYYCSRHPDILWVYTDDDLGYNFRNWWLSCHYLHKIALWSAMWWWFRSQADKGYENIVYFPKITICYCWSRQKHKAL